MKIKYSFFSGWPSIVAGTARNMGIAVKGYNDAELAEQAEEAKKHEAEMAAREAELNELEEEAKEMAEAASVEVPADNTAEDVEESTEE